MNATIGNALYLLAIGMSTVFFILTMVIVSGRILILLVNKFAPEAEKNSSTNKTIDADTMAILTAAVKKITGSKGEIENVEKLR